MRCLLAVLLSVLATAAAAQEGAATLAPYSVSYSIAWSGTGLGEGRMALSAEGEPGCYRYDSVTEPVAFVRWVYGSPREVSRFCIRDGVLRPSHFEYRNDRREKDNFTLDFDWAARKVKSLKRGVLTERELPAAAWDRFSLQMAVREWVRRHAGSAKTEPAEFHMVDDDRIVAYKFAVIGPETVEVPAGRFETVRVERIDRPDKSLRIWLAPSRDWLAVKIEHIEDGKTQLRMQLK